MGDPLAQSAKANNCGQTSKLSVVLTTTVYTLLMMENSYYTYNNILSMLISDVRRSSVYMTYMRPGISLHALELGFIRYV